MHWIAWVVIIVWVICAIINGICLKKMDVSSRWWEGGESWLLFAPFWCVPIVLTYFDWKKHDLETYMRKLEKDRKKIRK